jgi:hypothetical protein
MGGFYQITQLAFPNRLLSAVIFALGTAIWEEVTFRGLLFRTTEQTFGTWVGCRRLGVGFWRCPWVESKRILGRISCNHFGIRNPLGCRLLCNPNIVATNRLAFWLEF